MELKKGTILRVLRDQTYIIVGKWHGNFVLAPQNQNEEEVLMYTKAEIEDEIQTGWFQIEK